MRQAGILSIGAALAIGFASQFAVAVENGFENELLSIQHEWAAANYEAQGKSARRTAFEAVIEHCANFRDAYPQRAEAHAWEGIVLSTYAGEVSAFSAMKYAKAARDALQRAESIDADVLNGGVYASLGALYSKVPGGMMGFGDDELAVSYFEKAIAADPDNIDSNYFYGEFLLEHEDYAGAQDKLQRALSAPVDSSRPVFEKGRRAEIRGLLTLAERDLS